MACFLVPAAEAVITTVISKTAKSKKAGSSAVKGIDSEGKIPFSRKLKWLSNMLWGGSALLTFEHIWHGEITAWFPFLTAAGDSAETSIMLQEMATVGVAMAVLITAVWGVMLLAANAIEKKSQSGVSEIN